MYWTSTAATHICNEYDGFQFYGQHYNWERARAHLTMKITLLRNCYILCTISFYFIFSSMITTAHKLNICRKISILIVIFSVSFWIPSNIINFWNGHYYALNTTVFFCVILFVFCRCCLCAIYFHSLGLCVTHSMYACISFGSWNFDMWLLITKLVLSLSLKKRRQSIQNHALNHLMWLAFYLFLNAQRKKPQVKINLNIVFI